MTDTTNIAILGSTGSIGRNALTVVQEVDYPLNVLGLSAHSQLDLLCEQAHQFSPNWVVATDPKTSNRHDWVGMNGTRVETGHDSLEKLVTEDEIDLVLAAIVGSAGLRSTIAALQSGKNVALANKETLVAAGPLVMQVAKDSGSKILPVDSEHSAIFQAAFCGQKPEIKRIVLTASGGPFLNHSAEQLKCVTPKQALDHPTWDMGQKISIDSATMMNKALEVIEARWLFDLRPDQIEVVVHPQSIVHSLVEFNDGSVIAQMSPPDMKLPIQFALTYPNRIAGPSPQMDFSKPFDLQFQPPDFDRFPALRLGQDVATNGGTCGVVVNAANEAAVAAFLSGKIAFIDIVPACREIMNQHNFDPQPSLDRIIRLDGWARQEIDKWICA